MDKKIVELKKEMHEALADFKRAVKAEASVHTIGRLYQAHQDATAKFWEAVNEPTDG